MTLTTNSETTTTNIIEGQTTDNNDKMSSEEIKAEYTSSLADLTFNSKPLINVLTILAEENLEHASDIVAAIEEHLVKVQTDVKLPILYLIDCITKNIGSTYTQLFSQNIVSTFCNVFKVVDEKTRAEMFKLRQTWNDIFPQKKLYAIDVQINMLDPAWPVTAKPPSNSIHLNPKFLMSKTNTSSTTSKSSKDKKSSSSSSVSDTNPSNLDSFTMQQKLIEKQKELIELQQKKLELELLQTQVKLQNQMKVNPQTLSGNTNIKSQNILLKPEVAKQILSGELHEANGKSRAGGVSTSSLKYGGGNSGTTPRITPANSALVAAVSSKPIRDPRLLRQQQSSKSNISSNSVQLGSKNATTVDSNKVVSNKMSVRDNRNEPRLINNKDYNPTQNKLENNNNNQKPKISPKSNNKQSDVQQRSSNSNSSSNNGGNNSRSSRSTATTSSKSDHFSTGLSMSKTSSSSLVESKSDKLSSSSSVKSPTKHKKKFSHTSCSSSSSSSNSSKKSFKDIKSDREKLRTNNSSSKSDSNQITFKGIKGSTKNRNYVRRNRSPSISPELSSHDVDLRVSGGPAEKHARLQSDNDEKPSVKSGLDVDLRRMPATVTKKRPSTESLELSTAKKSKTEIFDVLFGNEDTDLRQLSVVQPTTDNRPPTPPPPIISSNECKKEKSDLPSNKKTNLDAVRAKLANATNKEKILSKSFNKKRSKPSSPPRQQQGDEDLRLSQTPVDGLNKKIIISQADEQCIKEGNLTKEQEKQLMNKIIAQIEQQKLREAQIKDNNNEIVVNSANTAGTTFHQISDDETEYGADKRPSLYGDKDDRIYPGNNDETNYHKYSRDSRRGGPYWRGGSGGIKRRHWDQPHIGGSNNTRSSGIIKPWAHQTNNAWRPIVAPNFHNKFPHSQDFIGHQPDQQHRPPSLSPPHRGASKSPELSNDLVLDSVNKDDVKTINIDGVPRDIRYYDETAIIFMSWDDPREISFQNDSRRVIFDDKDVYILSFNDDYKELNVNGCLHKVRLGGPTREIYIDSKPYECYFGGPGITIDLDNKMTTVKLDGPPPQVKIGNIKRTDLVAGKVSLITDAKIIVPVFLDAKLQKFVIDGETLTLKFVDALKTVLINNVPFNVEFGGLPKPIIVHDKKHFIRFSVLPRGVKPGFVNIKDMDGCLGNNSPIVEDNSQDSLINNYPQNYNINEPALPALSTNKKKIQEQDEDRNSNSPHFFQNFMQQQSNFDMLSSVMNPSSALTTSNTGGYQVENIAASNSENPAANQPSASVENTINPNPPPVSLLPPNININELFQKLVATGIVATSNKENVLSNSSDNFITPKIDEQLPQSQQQSNNDIIIPKAIKRNQLENLKLVTFDKTETLKLRQNNLYEILYTGMQCSSCGMRFPPEQSMQYSQHLDWHFRQNRKGKKNIRVAASRKWYYSLSDWLNYEEIEDLEEREKNYFDQQSQAEGTTVETNEEVEIPSVPADPDVQDAICFVCEDKFDHFFNEEKEEWHLKNAIRVDDKTYHPLCYEDYQESLLQSSHDQTNNLITDDNEGSENNKKSEELIPGLEIILDDDDDDEDMNEKNSNKEIDDEVIIEESSEESKLSVDEVKTNNEQNNENNDAAAAADDDDDDDDVIIHEVIPEKIILDDDDDDDENYESTTQTFSNKIATTTDTVSKTEEYDDGFMDVEEGLINLKNCGQIKIKSEPLDESDEIERMSVQEIDEDEDIDNPIIDETTSTSIGQPSAPTLISTIDGNIEFDSTNIPTTVSNSISGNKIKINITKALPIIQHKENTNKDINCDNTSKIDNNTIIDPSQPLPPGEEQIQLNLKPALRNVKLKNLPPVRKGSELTGMCSIM